MRRQAHVPQVVITAIMTAFLVAPAFVSAQVATETPSAATPAPAPAESTATVPSSAEQPTPAPQPVPYTDSGDHGYSNGDTQPPVSTQEARDFKRQFQDNIREAKQILKQIKNAKGAEEWQNSLNEVVASATDCINKFSQAAEDEKREVMNECWGLRLWDSINEVRDQFVPPSEIRNVMQEIKNQTRDLQRLKKQASKIEGAGDVAGLVDNLAAQLEVFKSNVTSAAGRDQREAIRDYWDAQMWEEVNKVRARVELPRELLQITKELKRVQKQIAARAAKAAFAFFGVDENALQNNLTNKQAVIEQIRALASQGNGEDAFQLMNEEIHQAWHPGDLNHLIGLLQETHRGLKSIKDADIKEQIKVVMGPIIEAMNEGDYREARDALVQFTDQMRRFERIFRPYYHGERDIDDRTTQALDKLEQLIQTKLQKEPVPATPAPAEFAPQETVSP